MEKRAQPGPEMCNSVCGSRRSDLRIERRDFDRQIYDREKLGIFSERIGPVLCLARQLFQQIRVTPCIFIRLGFAYDSFAQNVDGKADFSCSPSAQCRYHFIRISSRDKLACHFRHVPTKHWGAYPWSDARQANTNTQQRVKTIPAIAKILFEMLNDLTRPAQ
jgi:hypothetical protein